jgi:histidinol-phosphate aminotransferase
MAIELHPLARASLRNLNLLDPVARYRSGITERIFTNPCAPDYGPYPCPLRFDLQERFARFVESQTSRLREAPRLAAANVLFTPGSTVSIDLLVRAYCEPGVDALAICKPTFPVYRHYAQAYGIPVHEVPLRGRHGNTAAPDAFAALESKLIFLCHPTWPLGALMSLDAVREISSRTRAIVVVDEAYIEFSGSESAAGLIDEKRNLMVMRTFSKAWGLAGLRAGAIIGPEELLYPLRLLLEPFSFSTAAQDAVERRMDRLDWVKTSVAMICTERDRLASELARIPIVAAVYPSYANFLCVQVHDARAVVEHLMTQDLPIADVSRFVEDTIRISVSHRDENDRLLALLRELSEAPDRAISIHQHG